MVEDDIRLVLDENKSNFITYELQPGNYTFKDLSDVLFRILLPEYEGFNNAIDIEFDDISLKTKLVVRPGFRATKFHEKSFFTTILGLTPHWDYKNRKEYTLAKKL